MHLVVLSTKVGFANESRKKRYERLENIDVEMWRCGDVKMWRYGNVLSTHYTEV
jgi:hypothetical protein